MSIYVCVGARLYKRQLTMKEITRRSRQISAAASGVLVTTEVEHDVDDNNAQARTTTPDVDLTSESSWSTPGKPTITRFPDSSNTTRSPTPCSPPKSAGHCSLLVPLNPNSPYRHAKPLLVSYRATAYASPLATGEFATLPSPRVPVFRPTEHAAHIKRSKENVVALAYFRSGLLMFVALLVVWGPSSINRLYQIAHPENPSYGLNLAAALVLPMQGLWNAIIFASSTWPECKRAHRTIMLKLTRDALSKHPSNDSMQDISVKYTGDIECGDTGVSSEDNFELNSSTQTV